MKTTIEKNLARIERQVCELLKQLKREISDDYRCTDDPDDDMPGMQVTVATDDSAESWTYQTGDNSFSGFCYHKPHWAVIYLYRRSNSAELAKEAVNELAEGIHSAEECKRWQRHAAPQ